MLKFVLILDSGELKQETAPNGVALLCSSCQMSFEEPMELLVHVQEAHQIDIFAERDEAAESAVAELSNEV